MLARIVVLVVVVLVVVEEEVVVVTGNFWLFKHMHVLRRILSLKARFLSVSFSLESN